MRVEHLEAARTHDLRRRVLREHVPLDEVVVDFPEDHHPDTVHLGAVDGAGAVVAILTAFPEDTPHRPGTRALRLRGMAVDPGHQGQGVGSTLLEALTAWARAEGYDAVWANGRDTALAFYRRHGWAVVGEGFESLRIPHHVVVLDLS